MAFLSPIYRTVFYRFVDLIPIYPKCFSGAILKYLGGKSNGQGEGSGSTQDPATQPGTSHQVQLIPESDADSPDEHSPGMIIIVCVLVEFIYCKLSDG